MDMVNIAVLSDVALIWTLAKYVPKDRISIHAWNYKLFICNLLCLCVCMRVCLCVYDISGRTDILFERRAHWTPYSGWL